MDKLTKEKVQAKIEAGKKLTGREDMFWLTKIFRCSKKEAERIMTIVNNKDPNLIID